MSTPPAVYDEGRTALCDASLVVQQGRNASRSRPQSNINFTIAYVAVGHVLVLVCVFSWLLFKNRFERTRIRPTMLVMMAVMCSLTQMNYAPVQVITADAYPCWLGVVLTVLIVPFGGSAITGRMLYITFNIQFSQNAFRAYHASRDGDELQAPTGTPKRGVWELLASVRTAVRQVAFPRGDYRASADLHVLRFLVSRWGVIVMASLLVAPFLILALALMASDPVYTQCTNCVVNQMLVIISIAVILFELLMGLLLWNSVRKLSPDDPWGLRAECLMSIYFACVALLGLILVGFDDSILYPYSHQLVLSFGIWLLVIEQTVVQLILGWLEGKERERRRKTMVAGQFKGTRSSPNLLSGDAMKAAKDMSMLDVLEGILASKELRAAFEQHLVMEFGAESLFFLTDVDQWKSQYETLTSTTRFARAKRICKAYIVVSALYSINIPAEMTEEILKNFRTKHGFEEGITEVPRTLFDEAQTEIKRLLANGACLRFCGSAKYQAIVDASQQVLGTVKQGSMLRTMSSSLVAWAGVGGGAPSSGHYSSSQVEDIGSQMDEVGSVASASSPRLHLNKHHL